MDRLTERRREWVYRAAIIFIACAYGIAMVIASGQRGLVLDELYQLYFSMDLSFIESITVDPYSCPLFTMIAWVWYHIVPYGKTWLRLITIIFTCGALLLTAGCGRRIGNRASGILAMLIAAFTLSLGTHGALNWRPYALYAMSAAWILYLYIGRLQTLAAHGQVSYKHVVLEGLAMAVAGYTHYLALAFCAILFVIDLVLAICGKFKGNKRVLLAYALAVVLYLPWLICVGYNVFQTHIAPALESGSDVDKLDSYEDRTVRQIGAVGEDVSFDEMLDFLCCGRVNSIVFQGCMVVLIVLLIVKIARKRFTMRDDLPLLVAFILFHGMLTPFYLLATKTDVITTFWTYRYFVPLMPCAALMCVGALLKLRELSNKLNIPVIVLACALVLTWACSGTATFLERLDNGDAAMYEPIANYLTAQDDIEDDDVAWVTHSSSWNRIRELSPWVDYIINEDGARDYHINIIDGNDMTVRDNPEDLLQYTKLYVSMNSNNFHFPTIRKSWKKVMNESFVLVEEYLPYPDRHPDEYVRVYVRKDVYEVEQAGKSSK